jgi:hypothetical protein
LICRRRKNGVDRTTAAIARACIISVIDGFSSSVTVMRAQKMKSHWFIVVLFGFATAVSAISAMATAPGSGLLG